ncbi:5'/3'-nucleotidase SurE [Asaia spathodeae]|uniref:5'-nucleotidase SurE n=1 Tax=Asaia spathodeae TaxID=657016 RepID=A0ABX2P3Y3_9PROT|nr:5'/3'-nucleotidase SurE [Asaia spathodeae]GBR22409.1 exopolyphosphatase [Asaia spathodeae NBRC 105894]
MSGSLFQRVLLTNDDGIDAPGLAVLHDVASQLSDDVWVVAPAQDQSGISHALSLHDPLRVHQHGPKRFAVTGTPGDCVAIAARHILRDALPTLVLSGINRGANLGVETVFSGTVGAAMTAMLLDLPSIALSQTFTAGKAVPWETARALAPDILRLLARRPMPEQACLNVNFPACTVEEARPLKTTTQGRGFLRDIEVVSRDDMRRLAYHWLHLKRDHAGDEDGTETAAIAANHVSVTPLSFGRTNMKMHDWLLKQEIGLA